MSASEFRLAHAQGFNQPKQGRIRRKRTEVDGVMFDSAMEADRYGQLQLMLRAGEITDLELQVKFPFDEHGTHCFTYVADARYRLRSGEIVVEDTKGHRTQIYKLKKRLIEARYGIKISEWPEQRAKPKRRKSKKVGL